MNLYVTTLRGNCVTRRDLRSKTKCLNPQLFRIKINYNKNPFNFEKNRLYIVADLQNNTARLQICGEKIKRRNLFQPREKVSIL